jgi:hypothetical protein
MAVSGAQASPDLEVFPVRHAEVFLPKRLALDFRHGSWSGEFGSWSGHRMDSPHVIPQQAIIRRCRIEIDFPASLVRGGNTIPR